MLNLILLITSFLKINTYENTLFLKPNNPLYYSIDSY